MNTRKMFARAVAGAAMLCLGGCGNADAVNCAVFKVGDSEEAAVGRVPQESWGFDPFRMAVMSEGREVRFYRCTFSQIKGKAEKAHSIMAFKDGRLFNIFTQPTSEESAEFFKSKNVAWNRHEFDYGPPLAYEQLMLALADKREASEWELRFYSYDDVANYDWGLAVVAGVFKALSLPKELMSKDGKSEKLDHDECDCKQCACKRQVYALRRIKLGEQRADVELAHGRPALTDDSGVCYYIGNRLKPIDDCILVKYDEANRVEAIFDRDFRSRVLFEKLKK